MFNVDTFFVCVANVSGIFFLSIIVSWLDTPFCHLQGTLVWYHGSTLPPNFNLQQVGGICLEPTRGTHFNCLYTLEDCKKCIRFRYVQGT